MKLLACVIGAMGFATAVSTASAAEFSAEAYEDKVDGKQLAYIEVSGETEIGDYNRFLDVLPRAIALHQSEETPVDVWLSGPGGDLDEALELGKLILDLGFVTNVDEDVECASACALVWLGGASLYMHKDAKIGFHQAYVDDGESSIAGNAVVGHYLSEVGLEANIVEFVVSAEPESMIWLTPEVAKSLNLPVEILGE